MTRRWRMKEHQPWWYCSNFNVTNPTWSAQERERERECEFTQPRGKLYCSEVARSPLKRLKGVDQQNMKSIYSPSCCSKSVWLSFTKGEFLNNTLEAIFKYSKSENALKWTKKKKKAMWPTKTGIWHLPILAFEIKQHWHYYCKIWFTADEKINCE